MARVPVLSFKDAIHCSMLVAQNQYNSLYTKDTIHYSIKWYTPSIVLRLQGPVHKDTTKVKSIIMSFNLSSSQLARISLAEFVSKLIFI